MHPGAQVDGAMRVGSPIRLAGRRSSMWVPTGASPLQVHVSWKTKAILNSTDPRVGSSSDLRDQTKPRMLSSRAGWHVCARVRRIRMRIVCMYACRYTERLDGWIDRPTEDSRVPSSTLEYPRACSRTKTPVAAQPLNLAGSASASTRRGTENGK